ncbi:hypothetical protein S14_197 [Shewanella sp. phage 1/4]|uniref:hypothetical protein n=1 Tax=Shewanella phage 1/4 TaxID=1458859 RepID=UPI0004F655D5|nr:hypothetical protein S14_197 [Shewanella sp. phage 1/4]AHK11306.1 hypothetical protein S14_197 [Shewanella sp. phage 1/4]
MDDVTQLFIRACKSQNPQVRLRSVYRRFYLKQINDELMDRYITEELITIIEKYNPLTISKLFREMESFYYEDLNYHQKKHRVMMSHLRSTERSVLVGMRVPRRFKGDI